MKIWIDAQLSPILALWINENFTNLKAVSVRALGLLKANDKKIFDLARITCGNTSNAKMMEILHKHLDKALYIYQRVKT